MHIIIRFCSKLLFSVSFVFLSFLYACDTKNAKNIDPEPPPIEVTFALTDSIKVDASFEPGRAAYYLDGRIYQKSSTNQSVAYFFEEEGDFALYIQDTSVANQHTQLQIRFKKKTPATVTGTYNATDASLLCLQDGQELSASSWTESLLCEVGKRGTISISYDPNTDMVSGTIEKLAMPLTYYLPEPNSLKLYGPNLRSGGSTRNYTIVFKNARRVK